MTINDVDMWPVDVNLYDEISPDYLVSQNAGCCGHFRFRDHLIREIPMASVSGRVEIWRNVFQLCPIHVGEMAKFVQFRANALFNSSVRHWHDDQYFLSFFAGKFPEKFRFFWRDAKANRIDRIRWPNLRCLEHQIEDAYDAHLPVSGWEEWETLRFLFKLLLPTREEIWKLADSYGELFRTRKRVFW